MGSRLHFPNVASVTGFPVPRCCAVSTTYASAAAGRIARRANRPGLFARTCSRRPGCCTGSHGTQR